MKKTLIIIGIVVVLLVVAIWGYIFVFGTPGSVDDVFANFKRDTSDRVVPVVTDNVVDTPAQGTTNQPLTQLTTRPVAGMTFIDQTVRYVERGTGHVYDINLTTGIETQTTITSYPVILDAIFSPEGSRVALISENSESPVYVGSVTKNDNGAGVIESIELSPAAHSINFTDDGSSVQYGLPLPDGTVGITQNILTEKVEQEFFTELKDFTVFWGDDENEHTLVTTPSGTQIGSTFTAADGNVVLESKSHFGLMMLPFGDLRLISYIEDNQVKSIVSRDGYDSPLPTGVLPEKCTDTFTASTTYKIYCAGTDYYSPDYQYPDDWYKGKFSFEDSLWEVDLGAKRSSRISTISKTAGQPIDVQKITTNDERDALLFINKIDGTLWMYDLSLTQ